MFRAIERRVLDHDPHSNGERRLRTRLHLVGQAGHCRLHHDTYDPHANLLSLGMHVTHEARTEAAAMAALAWSAVKLLAR